MYGSITGKNYLVLGFILSIVIMPPKSGIGLS